MYGIYELKILPFSLCLGCLEVYGREAIRAAKRISNPGCYATSTQMLIAPLISLVRRGRQGAADNDNDNDDHPNDGASWPTVLGVSGYSGAGTVTRVDRETGRAVTEPKVSAESLGGGIRPYALTDHIHEREAGYHLSRLLLPSSSSTTMKVAFVPSVAPWFSGILSVLSMPLDGQQRQQRRRMWSAGEIEEMYRRTYAGERLVRMVKGVPALGDIEGSHGWVVGGIQVHSAGDRVVVVVRGFLFFLSRYPVFWYVRADFYYYYRVDWIICSRGRRPSACRSVFSLSLSVPANPQVVDGFSIVESESGSGIRRVRGHPDATAVDDRTEFLQVGRYGVHLPFGLLQKKTLNTHARVGRRRPRERESENWYSRCTIAAKCAGMVTENKKDRSEQKD